MPAPVALLVNPSAGGGRALRVARDVEQALRGHGLEVRRADTRDIDDAQALARDAASAGETVAVLSGDGMVGAVADALRAIGLLVPPASAGIVARLRGIFLIVVLIAVLLAIGLGIVELVALPFGGVSLPQGVLFGLFVVIAAVAIAVALGRRRRDRTAKAPGR